MHKNNIKPNELDLEEKVVSVRRVTKVVKGGRNFSFSVLVVVGDGKGVVGYGSGKAKEISEAVQKATVNAKKKLIKIPILRETLPYEVTGQYGAGKVLLRPASPGTGIIAGAGTRIVLESAGVVNVLTKSKKSSNAYNVVKATFAALSQLRDPAYFAAKRNITLEKLFNG